jgi:hypothetical protein
MRSSRAATSRTGRPGASSVSLFPFLAVLICTMGALILLLVVIARHARLQAAQAAQEAAVDDSAQEEELQADRELVQWRIEQIEASRAAAGKQLAESRLRLGQIEDHARQLAARLAQLEAAWADLNSRGGGDAARAEAMQQELELRRRQLAEAEQELAEARREAAERQPSYAVVPYEGSHGTRRQPIYIECREDAIVLQPEGVVMTSEDFNGPLGPGNPLDVALRARREYLLDRGRLDPSAMGEPYPLLLVRPGGIMAYYVAREAMKSWESEFGYELIGEDWDLAFPPADPQMAEEIAQAVEVARVRQMRLAAAVPRYATAEARPKYRAAPYLGGAVLDGGGGGSGGSGRDGNDGGRFGSGDATQRSGGGGAGDRYAAAGPPDGTMAPPPGDRYGDPGELAAVAPAGGRYGEVGDSAAATSTEGAIAGRPPREETSPQGAVGAAPRPGEWLPQEERASEAGGPSRPAPDASVQSLADKRGRDWGLPDAARGSVPITRPIRVECHADRLVIVPERGLSGLKEVSLGASTEDAVESFISSVWEVIDGWGIAGRGMYWRPVLNVRVAAGGERRFSDLQTLLDGSGLDVNRKE